MLAGIKCLENVSTRSKIFHVLNIEYLKARHYTFIAINEKLFQHRSIAVPKSSRGEGKTVEVFMEEFYYKLY